MAIGVLAISLAFAACGSDSSSDSAPAAAGDGSTGAGIDTAALKSKLKPFLEPPAKIEIDEPLKERPVGKTMAYLQCSALPCKQIGEGLKEATAALGMRFRAIEAGATPETFQGAAQQAVEYDPDVIVMSSIDASLIEKQLQEMHRKDILVVDAATSEPPAGAFDQFWLSPKETAAAGDALARYAILNGRGEAKVLYVNQSVFTFGPILAKSIKQVLTNECPSCSYSDIDTLPDEVGTKIPAKVVSELQTDSSINWVVLAYGAMSVGVQEAINAAGLTDRVKILTQGASKTNYQGVKSGSEAGVLDLNFGYWSYYVADSAARALVGQTAPDFRDKTFSYFVEKADLTFDINKEVFNPVPGYQEQFKALWGVN